MNNKFFIGVGVILGAIIAVSVIWYVLSAFRPATQNTNNIPPDVTDNRPSYGTTTPAAPTLKLSTQNGGVIVVLDFINNGVTIPDASNRGQYLLAGNLGYCFSNPQKCQAAPADNFSVLYNGEQQTFIIDLTKEPIGQARLDMEKFIVRTLGVSGRALCNLNYRVGVTIYVNPQYTGKNLGFSFCPGATALPL